MEKVDLKLQEIPRPTYGAMAVTLKISIMLLAAIAIFSQDLVIIFNDALRNETTSYILAIPAILIYLVYRKRKMVKAAISTESSKLFGFIPVNEIVGTLLFLASLLVYWYGSYTFTPLEYHVLALPIFVGSCLLILFNVETAKQLLFPTALLLLLVPLPADILYSLGAAFSTLSSELAYNLLRPFFPMSLTAEYGTPVISMKLQDGSIVPFAIDVACSGIYSQIGFVIFALFVAYLVRDKLWKKPLIFLIGLPLIYLLNVSRIIIILIIGYYHGVDLALNLFHLLGGWVLIFVGTLLLLVISEKLFKIEISGSKTEGCAECDSKVTATNSFCLKCGRLKKVLFNRFSKKDVAKLAGLILAVILIQFVQAPVFATTQGPVEINLQTAQGETLAGEILPIIRGYTLSFYMRDTEFEQTAGQDASLIYVYSPDDGVKKAVWVTIEIGSSQSRLHNWEACLIKWPISQGYQPQIEQIGETWDVELYSNPPIKGRYFIFEWKKSGIIQAVLYWKTDSPFKVGSAVELKHVKISVIAYPDNFDELPEVKDQLYEVAKVIAGHWEPIKTWSPLVLLVSQNGDKLAAVAVVPLGAVFVLNVSERRKAKRQNSMTCNKLSTVDRQIIEAVHQTEKSMPPTFNNISETYMKISGKTMDAEDLLRALYKLEKTGVIRRGIFNSQDEPLQIWRTECHF